MKESKDCYARLFITALTFLSMTNNEGDEKGKPKDDGN